MNTQSEKRVVVVTGAAAGIGLATSKLFAQKGYSVVMSDRNEERGQKVKETLMTDHADVYFEAADVTDYNQVKSLIDRVVTRFGRIDVLVNNAGIGPDSHQRAADHDIASWDKIISVNQTGVFYGLKACLRVMSDQGSGTIVNVASLAGVKASSTGLAYSASKFAVVGMTKSAALEYAGKGIRVNCVCPSFTDTALFNDSPLGSDDVKPKLLRMVPLKRFAKPEEISEAIFWLASDASSYVTGQSMILDGGMAI